MLETVFFGSIFLVFYAYFGYPLSLLITSIFKKKVVKKAAHFPETTFIITAYNEEKRIREKLENTLAVDYPKDKLQILVTSDGSTDKTHDIVREFEKDGVELLIIENRGGKENAQKEAVKHAKGEIIVFSDVATKLDLEGIKEVVSNFADLSIGCVSSEDRLIGKDGKPCGEGAYVRYEMWLRRLESRVNSLVGLSGSFFAARKDVCRDFSGEMQSDFRTLLNSVKLGYRGICDPSAIGYYLDVADGSREFERKVRTVIRGLTVFFNNIEFLNIFRYGLFSYQYFCHKLLRWLVPFFLLIALVSNLVLAATSTSYYLILLLQAVFYIIAIWGWQSETPPQNPILKIPMYFLTVNASIAFAWFKFLRGHRVVMWTPSKR